MWTDVRLFENNTELVVVCTGFVSVTTLSLIRRTLLHEYTDLLVLRSLSTVSRSVMTEVEDWFSLPYP